MEGLDGETRRGLNSVLNSIRGPAELPEGGGAELQLRFDGGVFGDVSETIPRVFSGKVTVYCII